MRFFLAFAIVLCIGGGAWLWQQPEFYWPARYEPSLALHLDTIATRLLGTALLICAGAGVMAVLHARRGDLKPAGQTWQRVYFVLAMSAVALMAATMWRGEVVANPESGGANHGTSLDGVPPPQAAEQP